MKKNEKGMSLIEILVVITIFAVLGVIVSGSLILTIQGTQKSESQIRVRENLNYSMDVMQRNLRSANSISDCAGTVGAKLINYYDQYGNLTRFSCLTDSNGTYIASGSARITSDSVSVTSCSFTCSQEDVTNPPVVIINLSVKDTSSKGSQGASVNGESQVYLRNQI